VKNAMTRKGITETKDYLHDPSKAVWHRKMDA